GYSARWCVEHCASLACRISRSVTGDLSLLLRSIMNFQFAKFEVILAVALAANVIGNFPPMAGSERRASISGHPQPPPGWVDFCARQPCECAGFTTARRHVALSWKAWMELVRVNNSVNWTIKPMTDIEHWGVVDRWSYPDDGYGDCEDYVL